jgi:hypothetical protein
MTRDPPQPERGSGHPGRDQFDSTISRSTDWLDALKNDVAVFAKLRALPDPQGTLVALVRYAQFPDEQLPILALALLGPLNERADAVLYEAFAQEPFSRKNTLALEALIGGHFHDDAGIARIVEALSAQPPRRLAELLRNCLTFQGMLCNIRDKYQPAAASWTQNAVFESLALAVRSAPVALLPRPDFQDMVLDHVRRDPDGAVETALSQILDDWIARPPRQPIERLWSVEEVPDAVTRERQFRTSQRASFREYLAAIRDPDKRAALFASIALNERLWATKPLPDSPRSVETRRKLSFTEAPPDRVAAWGNLVDVAHGLRARMEQLHPAHERIEDYIGELDAVAQSRLPRWALGEQTLNNDLQWRKARVAERMAKFPDRSAVRGAFERMLCDRPAVEWDYLREWGDFNPMGWRNVAWRTLIQSIWTVDEALQFGRLIVECGPWDREARKSKEAIVAIGTHLEGREGVDAFLAEMTKRPDVGESTREWIEYSGRKQRWQSRRA